MTIDGVSKSVWCANMSYHIVVAGAQEVGIADRVHRGAIPVAFDVDGDPDVALLGRTFLPQ